MGQGGRVSPPDRASSIWHEITEHPAVYNMEEMAAVDLPYPECGRRGKNLFLRDDKKRHHIPPASGGQQDLKAFRQANGHPPLRVLPRRRTSRPSWASSRGSDRWGPQ